MQSETRQNLIFITVLLFLTVPGGVILFRKKLDPDSRILGAPDPVPTRVAYMVRGPVPPGVTRVAPPKTMVWLRAQTASRVSPAAIIIPLDDDGLPLTSRDGRFQVLAVDENDGATSIWVVIWDKASTHGPSRWTFKPKAATGDDPRNPVVSVGPFADVPIPNTVRAELGENGLLLIPKEVLILKIELPGRARAGELHFIGGSAAVGSSPVFADSVAVEANVLPPAR